MSTQPTAESLYREIGPDAYSSVASWLRDMASEQALEWDDKVISPSVAWLAECVTMFDPAEVE